MFSITIIVRRLPAFFLLFLLVSCFNRTRDSEERLYSLYRQRIENSSYVLYEFAYSGPFAFSSDYAGLAILDSTTEFSRNSIEDVIPCSHFSTKPKLHGLEMVAVTHGQMTQEKDTLLQPIRQYSSKFNGVEFEILEYRETYGSATITGLMEYEFDSLQETKDSLIFYNVTKTFGAKAIQSTASFAKGNIKVVDSDNWIAYVDVEQLLIERGNIYKPTSPLELVPDRPVVGFATYRFKPRTQISSDLLTEYGVWKRVK